MGTLRVILKQVLLGQQVRTVLHYAGGDAVQTNAQGIGDYIRSMYSTHLATSLCNVWEMYGFSAKELDITTNPTIEYGFSAGALTGTVGTNPAPAQMALLVRWIALTAPPNRGRTYIGGLPSAGFDATGQWGTGPRAATVSWATGMLAINAAFTGLTQTITRVSKTTGVLVGSNIVDTFLTIGNPATQRRRRQGVGQ